MKIKSQKTNKKRLYSPPKDRVEKLKLVANAGYISANPNDFTYSYNGSKLAWWWS